MFRGNRGPRRLSRRKFGADRRVSPVKVRYQRVRFRRRYAESLARRYGAATRRLALGLFIVGTLGVASWLCVQRLRTATLLKIESVSYEGNIPDGLESYLGIEPGQSFVWMGASKLEQGALQKFPELQTLRIRRTFGRGIVVRGFYRHPVAFLTHQGKEMGLDADGMIFPVREPELLVLERPRISSAPGASVTRAAAAALAALETDAPDFYSRIKTIETDRILPARLTLVDGVVIQWGVLEARDAVTKAKNVLRLMERLSPTKTPAAMRFVATDRVVVDANWTEQKQTSE